MMRESHLHALLLAIALITTSLAAFSNTKYSNWDPISPSSLPVSSYDFPAIAVPSRAYRRIVTLEGAAILHQVVSVDRIAGVDAVTAHDPLIGWSFSDTPSIASTNDLDQIVALNPDLVVIAARSSGPSVAKRLRDRGVVVLELPEIENFDQARNRLRYLSQVVQAESQADQMITTLDRRARILAAHATGLPAICRVPTDMPHGQQARMRSAMKLAGLIEAPSGTPPAVIVTCAGVPVERSASSVIELPAGMLADRGGVDLVEAATFISTSIERERGR